MLLLATINGEGDNPMWAYTHEATYNDTYSHCNALSDTLTRSHAATFTC